MISILFIAYHFPPVGGAGVQRSLKFVRYLPEGGYRPVVISGPGRAVDRWTPIDVTLLDELPANIPIYRVESSAPLQRKHFQRAARWLGLCDGFARWWIPAATVRAERAYSIEGARLIFATMSPFASATVASTLSNKLGIPWVADLRDPWALDEMQVYPSFIHRSLQLSRMGSLLSSASTIVMNTPEATASLRRAFPHFRQKRVVTIPNGFDANDFEGRPLPRDDGKFRIVHTGYLHTDLGLMTRERLAYRLLGGAEPGVDILTRSHVFLLRAVERWCQLDPTISKDLELVFVGHTSEADCSSAEKSSVAKLIRFTGYQSHRESIAFMRTADLLFLPMHNLPPGRRSRITPGKTYEYIASGRPILAAVPDGDARDVLSMSGMSLICRPDDWESMLRILRQVYDSWRRNKPVGNLDKEFAMQFEGRSLAKRLSEEFDRLLG